MASLTTKTCNATGTCNSTTDACPMGQVCKGAKCVAGGGGSCPDGCDQECVVVDVLGACVPAIDGLPCRGASGMTCQKCVCTK
jgi:hypothetical protein